MDHGHLCYILTHLMWSVAQAMDLLDQEAEEDETFRENSPQADRISSHEANRELVEKSGKYRAILQQAGDSDQLVRQKWEEWEDNITQLTWSEVSHVSASYPPHTPT